MPPFHKRAITELLKTFNKQEIKDFKGYIKYKGDNTLLELYTIATKDHPHYNVTDNDLYKALRPEKPFNDRAYRVLLSELSRLARQFITHQAFERQTTNFNNTLSMELLRRRVEKMGKKMLNAQEKELKAIKKPDSNFYSYYFDHKDIEYQYVTIFSHRSASDSLQKAADFQDYGYIVKKLKFLFAMHNRRRIVKEELEFHLEEQLLDYLSTNPQEDKPLIHLYYLMLRLMRDLNDHASFDDYMAFYLKHRTHISPTEDRQLTTGAINYCFWNIQLGHLQYLQPRMKLAAIMAQEGFFLVDGHLPPYHFRNLVKISIEAGALDWATEFIETWLPKVEEKYLRDNEAFNRAYLHFAKGEYERQSVWMQKMEAEDFVFIDVQDEINFRILKLKTDFQLLSPKPLANRAFHASLKAFQTFLQRKKQIPKATKVSANNFQRALNQLHHKKEGKTSRVGDLRTYILKLQPVKDLPWLLGVSSQRFTEKGLNRGSQRNEEI